MADYLFLSFSVATDIIGLCLCFHLRRSIHDRWRHSWTLLGPSHCGWSSIIFFSLPSSDLINILRSLFYKCGRLQMAQKQLTDASHYFEASICLLTSVLAVQVKSNI